MLLPSQYSAQRVVKNHLVTEIINEVMNPLTVEYLRHSTSAPKKVNIPLDPVGQILQPSQAPCHPGQGSVVLRHPRCLTTALSILLPCTPPKTSAHMNKALLPTGLPHLPWGGKRILWPRLQTSQNSQCLGCCEPSAPATWL